MCSKIVFRNKEFAPSKHICDGIGRLLITINAIQRSAASDARDKTNCVSMCTRVPLIKFSFTSVKILFHEFYQTVDILSVYLQLYELFLQFVMSYWYFCSGIRWQILLKYSLTILRLQNLFKTVEHTFGSKFRFWKWCNKYMCRICFQTENIFFLF